MARLRVIERRGRRRWGRRWVGGVGMLVLVLVGEWRVGGLVGWCWWVGLVSRLVRDGWNE